jgi:hypothetical protein
LQKYTVRVKKPENKIFKFVDPSRVPQRARACINIRLGSKNRKTKSSCCLTRPSRVCQRARACRNIRFVSKSRKIKSTSCLTRASYFSELALAEIYGSGQKTGKQNLQVFWPEPSISASSSLQKYTVRVKKPETVDEQVLTWRRGCQSIYVGRTSDCRCATHSRHM